MTEIVISQGGGSDIPPGVYPVILAKISEPRVVLAQRGPNAGKEITLLDWTFVVLEGPYQDTELSASTSLASGPKSKLYAYLTALFGGVAPQIGAKFRTDDLTGRVALATVSRTEDGWPRIDNLSAMPPQMLSQQIGAATGAPVQPPQPLAPQQAPQTAQQPPAPQPAPQQAPQPEGQFTAPPGGFGQAPLREQVANTEVPF